MAAELGRRLLAEVQEVGLDEVSHVMILRYYLMAWRK